MAEGGLEAFFQKMGLSDKCSMILVISIITIIFLNIWFHEFEANPNRDLFSGMLHGSLSELLVICEAVPSSECWRFCPILIPTNACW